jgi:hypothetical protein
VGPEERVLKDLEELLRPRRMNDHLFDHLSIGIWAVPDGTPEIAKAGIWLF